TTVIDTQVSILPSYLDKEFPDILEANAAGPGMTFQSNAIVQEITGEDNQASKVVTDKAAYKADMVLIAAGVRPNTSWLDGIINLDDHGLSEIDDYLQTSDSNISAAGDATKVPYASGNDKRLTPLASNARRQAAIAAKNIAAGKNKF